MKLRSDNGDATLAMILFRERSDAQRFGNSKRTPTILGNRGEKTEKNREKVAVKLRLDYIREGPACYGA